MRTDVVIAGAGPAGWSLAAACAERGLDVALVAPEPDAAWSPTYCAWLGEVDAALFADMWPDVFVRPDAGSPVRLERAYGRIDNARLQARLCDRARLGAGRVVVVRARAADVTADAIIDERGAVWRGAVAVDARGAAAGTLYQTAWGVRAVAVGGPRDAQWMDFSRAFGDGTEPPSFLYALPLSDGTTLFEETSLVRGPELPIDALRDRLRDRLDAAGIRLAGPTLTERVRIPMDVPLAPRKPPIRFGAAAGMVHPATGFMLARTLAAAPRVADALAATLPRGPIAAAEAAWSAIWPGDAARRAQLYRFAASALATLDAARTRLFFRAFLSEPPSFVAGFVADSLSVGALVQGMTGLFRRLPNEVRYRLATGGRVGPLVRAALSRSERTIDPLPEEP